MDGMAYDGGAPSTPPANDAKKNQLQMNGMIYDGGAPSAPPVATDSVKKTQTLNAQDANLSYSKT